jgi:lambda repressor-like predicted transcriptional regulator
MSVTVPPERLRYQLAIRGMSARDLARKARLSDATVSTALDGKPIAVTSLRLMATALQATPVNPVIEKLLSPEVKAQIDE